MLLVRVLSLKSHQSLMRGWVLVLGGQEVVVLMRNSDASQNSKHV